MSPLRSSMESGSRHTGPGVPMSPRAAAAAYQAVALAAIETHRTTHTADDSGRNDELVHYCRTHPDGCDDTSTGCISHCGYQLPDGAPGPYDETAGICVVCDQMEGTC